MSELLKKIHALQNKASTESPKGIDSLLFDLSALENNEFLIFKRTHSLLVEKINYRIKSGDLMQYVVDLITRRKVSFCPKCFRDLNTYTKCFVCNVL